MAEVTYAPRALNDLERLAAFLAEADESKAAESAAHLAAALRLLATSPQLGRHRGDGLRELVISYGKTGYIALYRFSELDDTVWVLAIRHQREAGYIEGS